MSAPLSSRNQGANAAAVVKVPHQAGFIPVISSIVVSYSGAPAGGNFTMLGGTSGKGIDFDIAAAGAFTVVTPPDGWEFDIGEDVTLTLAPGGAGVVGKVNCAVLYRESVEAQYATH